jgi:hypothetical protein
MPKPQASKRDRILLPGAAGGKDFALATITQHAAAARKRKPKTAYQRKPKHGGWS